MGSLRNRVIKQSRIWLDESYNTPIPNYDYDYTYPITVYDAVRKTTDDNATTLTDELAAIYRLISQKQEIIPGGSPGQLMSWSGVAGTIGTINLVKTINTTPADRSNNKVPTERAVGLALDTKTPISDFNLHRDNMIIHITDVERNKWNGMAPLSSLSAHIANTTMHITAAERTRWNAKADAVDLDNHIYNLSNPHNVTAHQVNSYTRPEIDEMIQAIHESFFNYLNIEYNIQTDEAELVPYDSANWNPNYVLAYDDDLPDISDVENTYFALKPLTDYTVDETQDCLIYLKTPGVAWREIGTATMNAGDMVISYPDTVMHVWISGRFVSLFNGSGSGSGSDGGLWYPSIAADGTLSWGLSYSSSVPTPVNIKGEAGYTPVKGVDYFDGVNGVGIPIGGDVNDLIVKLSLDNYNTTWKSLSDILTDWALAGNVLPDGIVAWSSILGRPNWYQEFGQNTNGFISQKVITDRFDALDSDLAEFTVDLNELKQARDDFYEHQLNWDNPHHTTPSKIGAVALGDFTAHTSDFNNPHNVTKLQLGLNNVDNTSDLNKPISTATQVAIDAIYDAINALDTSFANGNFIKNITWDNNTLSLVLTFRDNTTISIPIPIANLQVSFDSSTNELVFTQPDNTVVRVDISRLIPIYTGSDSDNIHVVIENDNAIKATVIPGTIGQYEIAPSVNLRNSPTTTTQVVSDRSTKIATTEFVASQTINNLISYDIDRPLSANMGRILNQEKVDLETVQQMINDINTTPVIDNLDSTSQVSALSANMGRYLNLTKAPRVHTSPNGATYGIATISLFGHTRASEVDPLMDGTVFRGTDDGRYARADHRHPTDTTRCSYDDFNTHVESNVASEAGVHELRFYNNSLDYKDTNGDWVSVFGYLRGPGRTYAAGDVVQDLSLPKWAELECTTGGVSDVGTLSIPNITVGTYTGICIGQQISDGTVQWTIRAKRTHFLKLVPTPFVGSFLNVTGSNSYSVPIHNELNVPMIDCRFCDGTTYGTVTTVDMRDRFIMGKTQISDPDEAGGSDTRTLSQDMLPKVTYTVDISGLQGSTSSNGGHSHGVGTLKNAAHSHTVSGSSYTALTSSGSANYFIPLYKIITNQAVSWATGSAPNTTHDIWNANSTDPLRFNNTLATRPLDNNAPKASVNYKSLDFNAVNTDSYVKNGADVGADNDANNLYSTGKIRIVGSGIYKYLTVEGALADYVDYAGTEGPVTEITAMYYKNSSSVGNVSTTSISLSGTTNDQTPSISGSTATVNDHSHTVTINSNQTTTFDLNTANDQSTINVVSKHYKLAYIERIY